MDVNGIALTASCAGALGLGGALGLRLVPQWLAARTALRRLPDEAEAADNDMKNELARLAQPKGRVRNSSIVGLYGNALRHSDGAFTRAYHAELAPTIFNDDLLTENRCNALARMLAARKPVGTVIQFRLSVGIDPGAAILAHEHARDTFGTHPPALLLHDGGLGFGKLIWPTSAA